MVDHTHNGGPPIDDDKIASGWVKIYRDIREHPIVGFGQPVKPADPRHGAYSRAEAFQDLIMEAQYEGSRILISGEMVALGIGQLIAARAYLASRWNWSEKTVRTFLDHLASDGMIERGQPNGQLGARSAKRAPNVITICKYEQYQAYKQAISEYVETLKQPAEGPSNGQLEANWGPAKGQNLRTKESKKEEDTPQIPPPKVGTPYECLRALEAYNAMALRVGLAQAAKMTPDRQRKISARLKDYGQDGWERALANVEKSAWLTGGNGSGWRLTFDWLLSPEKFGKVHDGGFGNGRHAAPTPNATAPTRQPNFIDERIAKARALMSPEARAAAEARDRERTMQ